MQKPVLNKACYYISKSIACPNIILAAFRRTVIQKLESGIFIVIAVFSLEEQKKKILKNLLNSEKFQRKWEEKVNA